MGLFDFLKQKANIYISADKSEPAVQRLSSAEKERIMVDRVTTEDMAQFSMIPYQLNCPVRKSIVDGGHPFAYMDLNKTNQIMAKEELSRINEYISASVSTSEGTATSHGLLLSGCLLIMSQANMADII